MKRGLRIKPIVSWCFDFSCCVNDKDSNNDNNNIYLFVNLTPQNPNDISYVYSGYAPLSIRLTQVLARPGWRSIEEVLKMLPGPHFEERQQLPAGLHKKRKDNPNVLFALLLTKQNKSEQAPAC